jgi:hypothetical protein
METDILVISPCSGSKRYDAVVETEEIDTRPREELVREYPDAVTSAEEMYNGREHQLIQSAVQDLQHIATVDWQIISAGFGVLSRDTRVPSYDCTFSEIEESRTRARRMGLDVDSMTNDELVEAVGREKGIPHSLRDTLGDGHDLAFVALGTKYLLSAREALTSIPNETTSFAFASKGSRELVGDCHWVPATETERSHFGTTWLELRGKELLTLAENADEDELKRIQQDPDRTRELSTAL